MVVYYPWEGRSGSEEKLRSSCCLLAQTAILPPRRPD
jgi:hypothetical protein